MRVRQAGAGRSAWPIGRRAFLRAAGLLPALPLLAACGWFERSRPQPPPGTPTPPPTPTVTPRPAPVRLDTPIPATATTPRCAATPGATPPTSALPRGGGQLLYAGSLGGERGLILADLAADTRKLLVPGRYESPVWSPDGSRFAAFGVATPEVPTQQLAVFTAEGRALARYPIPLAQGLSGLLSWSPDGRTLLYQYSDSSIGRLVAWLIDDAGQRTPDLGAEATPWRWTPNGRLAYSVSEGGSGAQAIRAVWTVDVAGVNPRREVAGPFIPIDWSADAATLFAIGGLRAYSVGGGQQGFWTTTLLAIDIASGMRRTVLDFGASGSDDRLGAAAIVPGGGPIAIIRLRAADTTPTPKMASDLLIVDEGGRGIAQASPWPVTDSPQWFAWSPDGRHLSFDAPGPGGREIRIFAPFAVHGVAYPARVTEPRLRLLAAWSPDGRWLAYTDMGGIMLVPGNTTEERTYQVAADGHFPAWRPIG